MKLVPPLKRVMPFIHTFCKNHRGRVGVVMGYKLVEDQRPGRENYLRHQWYGVDYITGRDWLAFEPRQLDCVELQKITWAWSGSQTETARAKATEMDLRGTGRTRRMLRRALKDAKTHSLVFVVVKNASFVPYCISLIADTLLSKKSGYSFNHATLDARLDNGHLLRFLPNSTDLKERLAGVPRETPVHYDHAVR